MPEITINTNGPIIIPADDVVLKANNGSEIPLPKGSAIALCRCGSRTASRSATARTRPAASRTTRRPERRAAIVRAPPAELLKAGCDDLRARARLALRVVHRDRGLAVHRHRRARDDHRRAALRRDAAGLDRDPAANRSRAARLLGTGAAPRPVSAAAAGRHPDRPDRLPGARLRRRRRIGRQHLRLAGFGAGGDAARLPAGGCRRGLLDAHRGAHRVEARRPAGAAGAHGGENLRRRGRGALRPAEPGHQHYVADRGAGRRRHLAGVRGAGLDSQPDRRGDDSGGQAVSGGRLGDHGRCGGHGWSRSASARRGFARSPIR